jgi:uncharacterized RDD family membrane protein YckC
MTVPGGDVNEIARVPASDAGATDRTAQPPFDGVRFAGLRRRRMLGWALDVAICFGLTGAAAIPATFLGLLSFGILWAPAWFVVGLIPLLYNAILISGSGRSTWGQRLAGVRVETPDGNAAGFLQAGVHFILFYLGLAFTGGLIVLWSLFNPRKALVHDILSGLEARRAVPAGGA